MGQKKLIRFNEIKTFDNVLEYPQDMQGKWNQHFKNDNPVTLELACGKGEYSVGLGRLYPLRNFIGIDIKGNRIWRGAKTAIDEGLHNVAFLRSHIDKITDYFNKGEVAEIWITFPDPQLRVSRMKKRLTHPRFLRLYQQILSEGGVVNLKTDSPDLYQFTKTVIDLYNLEVLADDDNIYANGPVSAELSIKTHYEGLDIAGSNRIHYLRFRLQQDLPLEKDSILKEMFAGQPGEDDPDESND
jgi:tRNA (guanine-N7-)-methyltransferase